MNIEDFVEMARYDMEQVVEEDRAHLGVVLKIFIDGYKSRLMGAEDTLKLIETLADTLIDKSPEAALEMRIQIDREAKK